MKFFAELNKWHSEEIKVYRWAHRLNIPWKFDGSKCTSAVNLFQGGVCTADKDGRKFDNLIDVKEID